jgi:hypothetical protein
VAEAGEIAAATAAGITDPPKVQQENTTRNFGPTKNTTRICGSTRNTSNPTGNTLFLGPKRYSNYKKTHQKYNGPF